MFVLILGDIVHGYQDELKNLRFMLLQGICLAL